MRNNILHEEINIDDFTAIFEHDEVEIIDKFFIIIYIYLYFSLSLWLFILVTYYVSQVLEYCFSSYIKHYVYFIIPLFFFYLFIYYFFFFRYFSFIYFCTLTRWVRWTVCGKPQSNYLFFRLDYFRYSILNRLDIVHCTCSDVCIINMYIYLDARGQVNVTIT